MKEEEEKGIVELEQVVSYLEYHLQQYCDYEQKFKYDRIKKDRDRALDNMVTHADYIKNVLLREDVYPIIKNGSPLYIQFEDFWRYVKSDTPGYIETLKKYIENKKRTERDAI